MCKLSVVIPVYNTEKYIEKCVLSIENQKLDKKEFEIIIVNDGSTDNSLEKILSLSNKFANIIIVNQTNKGVSAARNSGFKQAQGEYVHFVDADDYLESGCYDTLLSFLSDHDLDILFFKYQLIDFDFNVLSNSFGNEGNNFYGKIVTGKQAISIFKFHHSVCTSLIRKKCIIQNNIKFSDNIWGEDILFITSLLLKSEKVSMLNYVCYNYVRYNLNAATKSKELNHLRKIADSYFNVSIELKKIVTTEENTRNDWQWISVIQNNINIFVYFGIIKYIISKTSDFALLDALKKTKQENVFPINKIKYGVGFRDRFISLFVNNIFLIRMLNYLYKIIS